MITLKDFLETVKGFPVKVHIEKEKNADLGYIEILAFKYWLNPTDVINQFMNKGINVETAQINTIKYIDEITMHVIIAE